MSRREPLFSLVATLLSGFFLAAMVLMSSDFVTAAEGDTNSGPAASCTCPESEKKSTKPKFAHLTSELDESDEKAALESVQLALAKVGDGASYVWHRANGRLSGLVQPTRTFRNARGAVCRHLVLLLTTGDRTDKTEGIACRASNGLWNLEG